VGATIKNQSAHAETCMGNCKRLVWDENSYKSIPGDPGFGSRAVCINSTTTTHLRYREASNRTLAVSHVWSHGQGGRPEDTHTDQESGGLNSCLHNRYTSIARESGCDSYWMDTPCIPEDHALRAESIAKINRVFSDSKMTLVCDRDLQEIDISDLTMRLRESILATVSSPKDGFF
jgi:hypothetical protein